MRNLTKQKTVSSCKTLLAISADNPPRQNLGRQNKDMRKLINISVLAALFFLTNCEPGMDGELKIFNESDKILTVKYCSSKLEGITSCDTTTIAVQPYSDAILKIFNKRSRAKKYYCCPCDIDIHSMTTVLGAIKKDPKSSDNWTISNKSKLKNNSRGPTVKCEFHVAQADL